MNAFLSLILKRKNIKEIKKHRDVTVAQVMNIANSMMKVSILALREREDHKLCSAVGYQFRTCCETVLKDPAGVPKIFIVYLRIIGCELASQDVKYDAVYEGADIGTSTREPAAEILLHLLWLRDKVEGYNKYTNSKEVKNILDNQINKVIDKIVESDIEGKNVQERGINIVKAIRKVRGKADTEDIYDRYDGDLAKDHIESYIPELIHQDIVELSDEDKYQIKNEEHTL